MVLNRSGTSRSPVLIATAKDRTLCQRGHPVAAALTGQRTWARWRRHRRVPRIEPVDHLAWFRTEPPLLLDRFLPLLLLLGDREVGHGLVKVLSQPVHAPISQPLVAHLVGRRKCKVSARHRICSTASIARTDLVLQRVSAWCTHAWFERPGSSEACVNPGQHGARWNEGHHQLSFSYCGGGGCDP
eukprot:1903815-Rhodomonas_salina.2